ncbi:hypothetical protein HN388_01225 [bacterium]|jgi:hypothetical protein|nr:hypothetical protein [bacterium]MBT4292576.1 hypothetical protein [bacterium]MBT7311237.1 hypothetical protein [bacterium]
MRYLLVFTLLAIPGFAQEFCSDSFQTSISGSSLTIDHFEAVYNCCSIVTVEDNLQGSTLTLTEGEIPPYCWCECCFTISTTVEDLPPGELIVNVIYFDLGVWEVWDTTVIIPDVGQSGSGFLADLWKSDCGETVVDDPIQSWGSVKALYR